MSEGEIWFRIGFSVVGLILVGAVVIIRGISSSVALVEVIGIAGAFFGVTLVRNVIKLRKLRK